MKKQVVPLGKILNIPIGLDYSWFLIFALLTLSLATGYFPGSFPAWPVSLYWTVAVATSLLLFASVLLHELGHSVVALSYKIPVRSITLFIFGGVAEIGAEPPSAKSEFEIAIAGPIVSGLLAGAFWLISLAAGGFQPLLALARYLAYINGSLALFNLIPGFPLDGGRVFRAIVWAITGDMPRATRVAATLGRVIAFGFIAFGVWRIFTGSLIAGLWIAFIGWFLENAANGQLQQQRFHDLLSGRKVAQAMSRSYAMVPATLTLQELADRHILDEGRRFFAVMEGYGMEHMIGFIAPGALKDIPRAEWPTAPVTRAMTPVDKMHLLHMDEDLWQALEEMERDGVSQLPVVEPNGQIAGVLSRQNVMSYIRILQEMTSA
jgi:Zn-dependent protease